MTVSASSELNGVLGTLVQLPAGSIRRASRALTGRRAVQKIWSLSAVRNVHHFAPALLTWTSASPARRRFSLMDERDHHEKEVQKLLSVCIEDNFRTPSLFIFNRQERGRPVALAGLPFELSPPSAVVLTSALSFGLVRAFIYFRVEYIIAAMVGKHVPRGGAKVLELDIREGRNLYYYPSDTVQVVAVSTNPNRTLLENQAIKAGVPIQIKPRGPGSLGLPESSMDAVVSVYAFRNIPDGEVKNVLHEALRVLQPGKPFIFVEPVGAKNPLVRAAQNTLQNLLKLTGSKVALTRDLLQYIEEVDELEDLEYEEIFDLLDPQLVGVAKKKATTKRASQDNRSVKRGFKKSNS